MTSVTGEDGGRVTTYAPDDRKLFCRHCGRSYIRHYYVAGTGFLCAHPTNTTSGSKDNG